ncbi:MAG: hypothetical protein AAFO81_11365 [Pseudomonadota bacterium]
MKSTHRTSFTGIAFAAISIALMLVTASHAQSERDEDEPPALAIEMTVDRIESIVARLDEQYQRSENNIAFRAAEREILIITDPAANRMRIMIAVNDADALDAEELMRLMQANFDSALDARYAIANDILWSTFIHRLNSLSDEELLSGIGQTINTADSFGKSYSSGELVFGGGDSGELQRRALIDELQRRGRETT